MILSNLLWMFILNECSNYSLSIPAWCPITNEPYFPDLVEGICFLVSPLCLRVKQRVSCKWCFKLDLVDIPCFLMIDPRNKSLQSILIIPWLSYDSSFISAGWWFDIYFMFNHRYGMRISNDEHFFRLVEVADQYCIHYIYTYIYIHIYIYRQFLWT
jgi:hypothetical protein